METIQQTLAAFEEYVKFKAELFRVDKITFGTNCAVLHFSDYNDRRGCFDSLSSLNNNYRYGLTVDYTNNRLAVVHMDGVEGGIDDD